ncbi:MAG: tRNA (adenosine(37)-N6)-dimethylallyltransferase MiaA [Microbacteriaceae bacterium]
MIVAIVGATGTGKSDLALDLAELLIARGQPVEIVNADASQLYRGMDIGTAKVLESDRRGIPHHLLDVLDVTEEASVARYQTDARAVIDDIESRGATAILVGGSGLYLWSVLFDFEFPGTDPAIRERLEHRLETEGTGALAAELREKDPEAFDGIDPRNGRRLVRALEVIEMTGKPFGAGLGAEDRPWREHVMIGLQVPRDELTVRLDARARAMFDNGLVDEVRGLILLGIENGVTASRAIGYTQALNVIHETATMEEAIDETAALTRRYARRQVSWFTRNPHIHWFDAPGDPHAVLARLDA